MDKLLEVLEWVYNVPSPLMDSKECLDKIMEEYGRVRKTTRRVNKYIDDIL